MLFLSHRSSKLQRSSSNCTSKYSFTPGKLPRHFSRGKQFWLTNNSSNTFVSFSFPLPSSHANAEESEQAANNIALLSQLRYSVDEVSSKVPDSALKKQICTPDSHGTITDDGIRCKQCNISVTGENETCMRVKQLSSFK